MHWRAPDWGCGGPGPAVSAGPIIPMIAARRDRPVRHHSLTPTRDSQNLNGSFRSGPGTNRPARRRSGRAVSVIPVLVLGPFSPGLEPNGFVFRISVPLFSIKAGNASWRTAFLRALTRSSRLCDTRESVWISFFPRYFLYFPRLTLTLKPKA